MRKSIKNAIGILLTIFLVYAFCGCSGNTQKTNSVSLEDQYCSYAEDCVEKGDNEKAISALEEGVKKTGSQKLKNMLESLKTKESDASETETETETEPETDIQTAPETEPPKPTFKISDKLLSVFNKTKEQMFGSKRYDYTLEGSECYYSDDRNFTVCYPFFGPPSDKPSAILGKIEELFPGKSVYTADEIQDIFSGYYCEEFYSEETEIYGMYVEYENYSIYFDANIMNSYTSFRIKKK